MRTLEIEADYLEAILPKFTRQLQERVAASRRHRNSLVPFHSLPAELVGDIFFLSFDGVWTPSFDNQDLQRLASVSYAWWQAVKSHSKLWTFIDMSKPQIVPIFLRRSGGLPLFIRWHQGWPNKSVTPELPEAVRLLCAEGHRWRDLDVRSPRISMLDEVLRSPLPLLESLGLDLGHTATLDLPAFIGGPRLTTLRLGHMLPPVDTRTFAGLQTLHLDSIPDLLPVNQLFSILRVTQQLEDLQLGNINTQPAAAEDTQILGQDPITLAVLAALHLNCCSSQTTTLLLQKLVCPELNHLDVVYHATDDEDGVPEVLEHLFHTVAGRSLWTTALRSRSQEKIRIYLEEEVILSISASGFNVSIIGNALNPLSSILTSQPPIPFHGAGPIPVELDISSTSDVGGGEPTEPDLLLVLLDASIITLDCGRRSAMGFLHILGSPEETEGGDEWACPQLRSLTMTCRDPEGSRRRSFIKSVNAMVQARRAATEHALADLSVEIKDGDGGVIMASGAPA